MACCTIFSAKAETTMREHECSHQVIKLTMDDRTVAKHVPNRKWTYYARRTVPSTDWLFRNYRWTEDFMADAMAGFIVAVLNIPQGMAYSILANVDPTVGLYMAIVPALVYSLLGTSRHVSIGVLSVVCLLTGRTVDTYTATGDVDGYGAVQVATAVTLVAGLVQLAMFACRMGILCTVLTETFVHGFTTAVAVVVSTSQLKELLGIAVVGQHSMMKVPHAFYAYATQLDTINWTTTTVSVVTVTTMLLYNAYCKEKINRTLPIPMPIELVITVLGSVIFGFTTINEDYNIAQMGDIKSGLPDFEVPPLDLLSVVFIDACVIAIVSYSVTMSLAMDLSERLKYPLDANQELFAQGMSNVVGSFFQCLPCGGSPSRSASQYSVGGRTQMTSIVAAGVVTAVLLWIDTVFEPLPRCMLASIVVVSLGDIMIRVMEFPTVWGRSKSDGIVWICTFASVLVLGIDCGMVVGIGASLTSIFAKGVANGVHVLGRLPDTGMYVRFDTHGDAVETPNVKVLRYTGSLNVINRNVFKSKVIAAMRGYCGDVHDTAGDGESRPLPCLVLDMTALHYIDSEGGKALCELIDSLDGYGIYLTTTSPETLSAYVSGSNCSARLFPTIHDAVDFHIIGEK